jgi:hypothetical protein
MTTMDPLADLEALLPAMKTGSDRASKMSTRIGIPKEDLALFDELANDPKLTDISQEIAYLRYLRVKLQQSIEVRRDVMVIELGRRMLEAFDQYLWSSGSPIPEGSKTLIRDWMKSILERMLNEHFPIMDLDKGNAAALRDMVVALGKLASEWKKVTEGITVRIESNEDELFLKLIRDVMIPSVPRHMWVDILTRCEALTVEMAPMLPEGMVDYIS